MTPDDHKPPPKTTAARPLNPERLTWAALLGRWMTFARSALALPENEEGRRLRESVADIITLQAVWFALQHLDELDNEQRALGLDRAELLINRHAQSLAARWPDEQAMPDLIRELINDVANQLQIAASRLC